jgi:hypothetical protein
MSKDRGELSVGQIEGLDESRINHDAPARHAIGIQVLGFLHVELPFPTHRIRAEGRCGGYDAARDRGDARELRLVGIEHTFVARCLELSFVGLRRALVDGLARHQHLLLAVDADSTCTGGADRFTTGCAQQYCDHRARRKE